MDLENLLQFHKIYLYIPNIEMFICVTSLPDNSHITYVIDHTSSIK